MRNTTIVGLLASAALVLSGCSAITRDLRHPGGYPGRLLDKRTFDASESKQLQLLRFTIILAMAARMAGETSNDSKDADAIAEYLAATADEINYTAANVYELADGSSPCAVGPAPPPPKPNSYDVRLKAAVAQAEQSATKAAQSAEVAQAAEASVRTMLATASPPAIADPPAMPTDSCGGYYVNFEADVPLIEFRMMRLLFATLPRDHIRKFAEDIQKGNFLGSAWNGLRLVFVGVKGLHTASGTYRSGQEALIANFSVGCSAAAPDGSQLDDLDETRWTVKNAVACLGLSPDSLFGPHPGEVSVDKMPKTVTAASFAALMRIARISCVRLPIGTADNSEDVLKKARDRRAELCARLHWNPRPRVDEITRLP